MIETIYRFTCDADGCVSVAEIDPSKIPPNQPCLPLGWYRTKDSELGMLIKHACCGACIEKIEATERKKSTRPATSKTRTAKRKNSG